MNFRGKAVIENYDWPNKGKTDASALLSMKQPQVTPQEVMALAQGYGVGYMLSDFGVTLNAYQADWDNRVYSRLRYTNEPHFSMITDITQTMEELGYGWCFAHWYGPYCVVFCIPATLTSTYERVDDRPYYIDQGMMALFQKINGVG